MPRKKRRVANTTRQGQHDEQALARYLLAEGWNVEIARVSKGHFDRIAWKKTPTGYERLLFQSKRNGKPEKGFFTREDPIYLSKPHERVWACHWSQIGHPKKGTWTFWYWDFKEEGLKL